MHAAVEVMGEAGEQQALIGTGCNGGWVQSPSPSPGATASNDSMAVSLSMSWWQREPQLLLPVRLLERTRTCVGSPPTAAAPCQG